MIERRLYRGFSVGGCDVEGGLTNVGEGSVISYGGWRFRSTGRKKYGSGHWPARADSTTYPKLEPLRCRTASIPFKRLGTQF
jgi:hypothetical protein